jgi:hypothetical protein
MRNAALFRDRPTPLKIVTGLLVPAAFGALTGLVLGVSTPGYWALSLLALAGGVLAGFEHPDGWSGADRGLLGGTVFGTFLLLAHTLAGTHAQVSLPKFAPIFVVFTAVIGMFAGALGGRLRRGAMEGEAGDVSARS